MIQLCLKSFTAKYLIVIQIKTLFKENQHNDVIYELIQDRIRELKNFTDHFRSKKI